jgi:hypothetical protein
MKMQPDKEGHAILIKGEIHQKEITIINLYAPNISATNFIKYSEGPKSIYRFQHSGNGRL